MLFRQKKVFKLVNSIFLKKFIDHNFFLYNDLYKLVDILENNNFTEENNLIFKNKTDKIDNFNFFFFKLLNLNNFNIKTLVFFIFNLKKINPDYSVFSYDLLFRFSNLSYFRANLLKNTVLKIPAPNANNIFLYLTSNSNIDANFYNIFKRLHFLTVGNFKYLPESCTISGYYSPLLVSSDNKLFFSSDSEFTNLNNFKYLNNYSNNYLDSFKIKASFMNDP